MICLLSTGIDPNWPGCGTPTIMAQGDDHVINRPWSKISGELMNHRIAVVHVCDANYHNLTLYSLASIAKTHKAKLNFHIVQIDYQQPVPPKLREFLASRGHGLITTTAAPLPVKGESRKGSSWEHVTDATFHKSA